MSIEKACEHLKKYGFENRIRIFDQSSATVELAARALGCEPALISKSLTFTVNDTPVMILAAGDKKIDNAKFKAEFGVKAKMLTPEEVDRLIGHSVGGVCPFGVNDGVKVFLDVSMKRFERVFPAAGGGNTAVELSIEELERCSGYEKWVDVCK